MGKTKKAAATPAPALDIIKLEPQPPRTVTFKHHEGKGWEVYAAGTDNPHEAVHMVMSIAEATQNLPPICAMYEATKQPDGSWRIGQAAPEKLLERLFEAAERQGR